MTLFSSFRQELSSERAKITAKMNQAVSDERAFLMEEAENKVKAETQEKFDELQKQYNEKIVEIKNKYQDETIIQLKRMQAANISYVTDIEAKTSGLGVGFCVSR